MHDHSNWEAHKYDIRADQKVNSVLCIQCLITLEYVMMHGRHRCRSYASIFDNR